VPASWVDYNGHVHESRYLQAFSDATDALLGRLALDPAVGSYFTVETHLRHLLPLHAGEVFHVTTEVVGADEKRLRLSHVLHRDADVVATAEQTLVHVDVASGRAAPVDATVRARVDALL
jgi:carnitine 3-dehydrogenase / betainyl-CoA thioesterase